jgi:hypothetical protein
MAWYIQVAPLVASRPPLLADPLLALTGGTSVLVGVYGPKNVPPKREDPEKAVLEVLWKPKSGIQGRRSLEKSATVSCTPSLVPVRSTKSVKEGFDAWTLAIGKIQSQGILFPCFSIVVASLGSSGMGVVRLLQLLHPCDSYCYTSMKCQQRVVKVRSAPCSVSAL